MIRFFLFLALVLGTGFLAAIYEYVPLMAIFVTEIVFLLILLILAVAAHLLTTVEEPQKANVIYRGEKSYCRFLVRKAGLLPVPRYRAHVHQYYEQTGDVEDNYYFGACPRGDSPLAIPVYGDWCDLLHVEMDEFIVYDYLALFGWKRKGVFKQKVYIIPNERHLDLDVSVLSFARRPEEAAHYAPELGGEEFRQLREYRLGDSMRNIDWKRSAALDNTLVREFAPERERVADLYLNTKGYETLTTAQKDAFFSLTSAVLLGLLENVKAVEVHWCEGRLHKEMSAVIRSKHDRVSLFVTLYGTDLSIPTALEPIFSENTPDEMGYDKLVLNVNRELYVAGFKLYAFSETDWEDEIRTVQIIV